MKQSRSVKLIPKQPNNMENEMQNTQTSKSRTWLVWVVVVAVVAVGLWMWMGRQAAAPGTSETAGPALGADDTTESIEAELNATDLGNIEAELQATEADLNSL